MISVVIPVYNEEENIPSLYSKLKDVLERIRAEYEIIFIDDGSTDKSFSLLAGIHSKDGRVKVIKFRKNFGQTAAMSAGFEQSKGDVLITMDSDLQNDPEDIPMLLKKLDEGFDLVSGWRAGRKDPVTKKIPSMISNTLARYLTGVDIHDSGCTLKAYRRETLQGLELYGELHRYIPALVAWKGFRIGEVKVTHHPREKGKTKYGISRLFKGVLDLMLVTFWQKYSNRPIHIFGGFGLLLTFLGVVFAGYLGLLRIFYDYPLSDKPAFLVAVLMIVVGVQFIGTGILADIMLKTYYGQGTRKAYSIEKKII